MSSPFSSETPMAQRLEQAKRIEDTNIMFSVGLDLKRDKVPVRHQGAARPRNAWAAEIIEQTADIAGFFKFNLGFWLDKVGGLEELSEAIDYAKYYSPDTLVIIDAKSADIGASSEEYAAHILNELDADVITLNPYLGFDAIDPFFQRDDRAFAILCKTSNPGSADLQNLQVADPTMIDPVTGMIDPSSLEPVYIKIARKVDTELVDKYGKRFMLVVGATHPDDVARVRNATKNILPFSPGVSKKQGGKVEDIIGAVIKSEDDKAVIHVSSDISNSENPGAVAAGIVGTIADAYRQHRDSLSAQ